MKLKNEKKPDRTCVERVLVNDEASVEAAVGIGGVESSLTHRMGSRIAILARVGDILVPLGNEVAVHLHQHTHFDVVELPGSFGGGTITPACVGAVLSRLTVLGCGT